MDAQTLTIGAYALRPQRTPVTAMAPRTVPALRGFRLRLLASPSRVELPGFQAMLGGHNSVLLLGPADAPQEESLLEGGASARELEVPPDLLAIADRELGVLAHGSRRFRMPIARLPAEAYFRWRMLGWSTSEGDAGSHARQALCRQILLAAASDWRRRPVPSAGTTAAGGRSRFELAQQAAALIEEHWQEGIGLDALAAHFGLSPFHLLRSFRRGLGLTPHQYLLQLRLRRSFDLLEASGLRIIDVALATGFSSHGHYSTAFRKTFGISPLAYQRLGARELRTAEG